MMPEVVTTVVLGVAALACLGSLMGSLARFGWPFELASHFRVQYTWVLLVSAGLLWLVGDGDLSTVAWVGAAALINLIMTVPLRTAAVPRSLLGTSRGGIVRDPVPRGHEPRRVHGRHVPDVVHRGQAAGQTSRMLFANVQWSNRSYAMVRRLIHETQPDFMIFSEVTKGLLESLRDLRAEYTLSKAVLRRGGFGILLVSRAPVECAEAVRIGRVGLPSLIARLELQGHWVTVIGTHPLSPTTPRRLRMRNQQLEQVAEFVRQRSGPLLLVGDLNTTSWSPAFQDVLRATRLRDSRVGFGLQPSWPVSLPFLRIPIDHCLVSPEIVVHRRRLGPPIGSDHYPVLVDFSIEA